MVLDSDKKEHLPMINMYKKCKGIALISKYLPELNPLNKMYVINSLEDWEKVEGEFPAQMMTARCDCPKGINGKLPNGQTFHRDRVRGYIEDVKSAVPDSVIILENMKSGTNERIHTQGGANIEFKIGDHVYIDYVGPGFDARELCLGKAVHESWNIPWEEVVFMKDSAMKKYKTYEIVPEEYVETAKERIRFLIRAFPDRKEEIIQAMPPKYAKMHKQIFRDIVEQIIIPLYIQHERLSRDGLRSFCVEVNIIEDGTLVPMEIEVPDRFKNKDRDIREI